MYKVVDTYDQGRANFTQEFEPPISELKPIPTDVLHDEDCQMPHVAQGLSHKEGTLRELGRHGSRVVFEAVKSDLKFWHQTLRTKPPRPVDPH